MTLHGRAWLARLGSTPVPTMVAALAFVVLYWEPMTTLGRDWWADPDASHGLLLGPLAVVLAWRLGFAPHSSPQPRPAMVLLTGAVVLRYLSGLAAETFTMRISMLGAAVALTVYYAGLRQVRHWWLPASLLALSLPVPDVLLNSLAVPLQLKATELGAALLEWRQVPVRLAGNVIQMPGRALFVTEACSGLRSLTALLGLGVLAGGLWLRTPWCRAGLAVVTLPVALALNGVRIFLTGFLAYNVDPSLADGVMHYTEGWGLFVVAFLLLMGLAWVTRQAEKGLAGRTSR